MRKFISTLITAMLLIFSSLIAKDKIEIIIDSDMTFEHAIEGTKAPQDVIDSICLLDVKYYSFDGKLHKGQLVIHKAVKENVKEIFDLILKTKFPVNKVVPIVKYDWSDDASMDDNNTSAFCYRFIAGTKRFSNHAFGRAVDINPFNNPVVYSNGRISPKGAKYKPKASGTFSEKHPVVKAFLEKGWRWGGNFNSFKDYHHFDKK
ncbi:M15 family metallopeptidase [Bacteroidota bacterium]